MMLRCFWSDPFRWKCNINVITCKHATGNSFDGTYFVTLHEVYWHSIKITCFLEPFNCGILNSVGDIVRYVYIVVWTEQKCRFHRVPHFGWYANKNENIK